MIASKSVVNIGEFIGKTVGKRRPASDALATGLAMQRTTNELMKSCGHKLWPRGVQRFASHEEADEWTLKMMSPNKAVINIEETIGKTVGKRRVTDTMRTCDSTKAKALAWQRAFPTDKVGVKGVVRFNSHEEANAWMTTNTKLTTKA